MRQIIEHTPIFRRRDEIIEIDFCEMDEAGRERVALRMACSLRVFRQALGAANAFEEQMRADQAAAAAKVIRLPKRRRSKTG